MADTLASLRAIIAEKDATIEALNAQIAADTSIETVNALNAQIAEDTALIDDLQANLENTQAALEGLSTPRTMRIWQGGQGSRLLMTLADDEAEALGNLTEADPMFLSIGCFAYPLPAVEGFEPVCIVPDDHTTGTQRRNVVLD